MKRPLLTSRRKVMSALINAYPGGRECAAAQLGLELKKFDNQAYESNGHRPLADEQIYLLEQVTGTSLPEAGGAVLRPGGTEPGWRLLGVLTPADWSALASG